MKRDTMPKKYSNKETIESLKRALQEKIDDFYNAKCLNWTGQTSEGRCYSEVIAEYLLKDGIKEQLSRIITIEREDYNVPHNDNTQNRESGRHEEILAKDLCTLYNKKCLDNIGNIINYQIPLKAVQTNKAGKIDLIAFRDISKNALLIELKHENNIETLLRAVLEISTYYQQLFHKNFISSFDEFKNLESSDIKKTLLIVEGSTAYDEAKRLDQFPNLKTLIHGLEVDIFGLRIIDGRYETERINP
jgi:hypothetical protein